MLTADNIRRGMPPEEARRQAAVRLGAASSLQSQHRDVRGFRLLEDLVQDLRFAARLMRKERWFSAAAIAAIALGIGANTVGFTIINAAFLRGFPFEEAEGLRAISWRPTAAAARPRPCPISRTGDRSRDRSRALPRTPLARSTSAMIMPPRNRPRVRGSRPIISMSCASAPSLDAPLSPAKNNAAPIPSSSSAMKSGRTGSIGTRESSAACFESMANRQPSLA